MGRGAQCFVTDQLYKDIGQIDPFSADMTGGEVARRMVTMREIGRAVALRMKLDGETLLNVLVRNAKVNAGSSGSGVDGGSRKAPSRSGASFSRNKSWCYVCSRLTQRPCWVA